MTRLEKCELLKSKGYTYDPDTGKIFGIYGKEIINKNENGYIIITTKILKGKLRAHHFAWYMVYGNVDFEQIDHINRNRSDNRIKNLRNVTNHENQFNTNAKGYYWDKSKKKWRAAIRINYDQFHLGFFDIEEDARNAYLEAKEKYHIIKNPQVNQTRGLL